MKASKNYLRFCGIDIAKRRHVACIVERDGRYILRPKSFNNDAEGFQKILNSLKQTGRSTSVLVGMEATGHYWYALHDFLVAQGYTVVVLNPIQTSQQAKQGIRKCKTDKSDAFHVATLLRTHQYKPAIVPGELAMTCRQLTRLRYRMVRQGALIKQLVNSRLYPLWPEYETFFADHLCSTSRTLLKAATSPQELLALDTKDLSELIQKASRGKLGPVLAQRIRQTATHSVGVQRGRYGRSACIRILIEYLDAVGPIRKKLEAQIEDLAHQLPPYLETLPGATPLTLVSLYGEVDPIEAFTGPSQLVAFAGLDPKVFQTGQYDAPRRHVSKRGSPYLRRTLWQMAHRAVCTEGELRDYWRKKRRQNKHHLVAVTAAASKLTRIVWRIMTDRRHYIPRHNNTNS